MSDIFSAAIALHRAARDLSPSRDEVLQTVREIEHFRHPGNTLVPVSSRKEPKKPDYLGRTAQSRRKGPTHYIDEDEDNRTLCGKPTANLFDTGVGYAECVPCIRISSRVTWSRACRRYGYERPGCACPAGTHPRR